MKFVIQTPVFNSLISKILNIVPVKPTTPVLYNFLIEAANDELILTATDLNVGIRCSTDARIIEEGSIAIPAKRLCQLVRELTTATVEISSNSNEITTLIAGSSRFKMNGMSKNEFPELPIAPHEPAFTIEQKALKELLYRTSFAISKEDNRYVLTGALLSIANGIATIIGTDGKRLARAYAPIQVPHDFSNHSIIPFKAIDEILKNLTDEGEANIHLYPDKMMIQINQTLIMTKLLTGDYPEVERVIPENSAIIASLHREELIALLRQVSLFISDQNHSVRFAFENGELKLSANSSDIGEGQVSMPVNYHGEKLEIAFNPGYFIDILRHCKEETVTIGLNDSYNPGIFVDGESSGNLRQATPLFVLMPMRLSEE